MRRPKLKPPLPPPDPADGRLMTLAEARLWLAEVGVRRRRQTLWDWLYYGAGGVKLKAVNVAGRWHTSKAALREFFAEATRMRCAESALHMEELRL